MSISLSRSSVFCKLKRCFYLLHVRISGTLLIVVTGQIIKHFNKQSRPPNTVSYSVALGIILQASATFEDHKLYHCDGRPVSDHSKYSVTLDILFQASAAFEDYKL